ncbi:MAG: hypothetical protein J0L88_07245 [Xanthomonadales bacterium]|nr:hypothetical protein [Xanthomonadales bacterium]
MAAPINFIGAWTPEVHAPTDFLGASTTQIGAPMRIHGARTLEVGAPERFADSFVGGGSPSTGAVVALTRAEAAIAPGSIRQRSRLVRPRCRREVSNEGASRRWIGRRASSIVAVARIERGQVDLVIEQVIERMLEGAGQQRALQIERDEAG